MLFLIPFEEGRNELDHDDDQAQSFECDVMLSKKELQGVRQDLGLHSLYAIRSVSCLA